MRGEQHPATHTKTPRAKNSPAAWGQSLCPDTIRTRGARAMARGGWKKWLGAITRAPPVRKTPRLPGARAGSSSRKTRRKPRAVSSRSILREPNTSLSHPAPDGKTRQARQGLVRPAFAVTPHAVAGQPPEQGCGSNAAGRGSRRPPASRKKGAGAALASTGSGHSRGKTLGLIHLDPAGPRAGRGVASQASGPQVRCPRAETHRLPPARAPSTPAIRSGRKAGVVSHGAGGCGKCGGFFESGASLSPSPLPNPSPQGGGA